jgi:Flp pilus assembly protein TadB
MLFAASACKGALSAGWPHPGDSGREDTMNDKQEPQSAAAGALLALAILAGAIIGMVMHQPSAGVVGGVVVGALVAVLYWLRDRRRKGH